MQAIRNIDKGSRLQAEIRAHLSYVDGYNRHIVNAVIATLRSWTHKVSQHLQLRVRLTGPQHQDVDITSTGLAACL